jgi:hypothetical protein
VLVGMGRVLAAAFGDDRAVLGGVLQRHLEIAVRPALADAEHVGFHAGCDQGDLGLEVIRVSGVVCSAMPSQARRMRS